MAATSSSSTEVEDLDEEENIRFEDLKFFKRVLTHDPNKGRMVIKLCRLMNKIVPIFLSRSFHTMSCLEMYRNYPNGKYWSKASLFVVGNADISRFVWDEIQKESAESSQEITHPLLSKELCDRFKDDFQISNADREYACGFNSWVLQQIPMYPSMMFQWWISSSYYLLKIEKLIADFYHLKFPQYLEETVQHLFDEVKKARFCLNLGLQCLLLASKDGEIFKIRHYEEIISSVSTVIYYFKTDDSMINAIKCLKRMCWSNSSAREVTISLGLSNQRYLKKCFPFVSSCKHEFVLPPWDYIPSSIFIKKQLVACTGCRSCMDILRHQRLTGYEDTKKMYPDVTLDTLKSFISKFLIQKGRFHAEDQKALLRHADDPEIWKPFYTWVRNRGFLLGRDETLHEADKGPFYDVLVLTVELEQSNLEAAITQRLTTLSGIQSLAVDCEGPDVTLKEIKSILMDIELEPPWTFATALEESQRQVCLSKETYEYHEDPTAFFQYSIDSMVLSIAELWYGPDAITEEWDFDMSFIQYLLPCFLSSYFDLKKDKRVSLTGRNFYLNFIKHLIKYWEKGFGKGGLYPPEETVCFLKWKFETVCMDLEGYLYNDLEDTKSNNWHETDNFDDKIEEEQPRRITSIMKSDCLDVLTDFLGKTDQKSLPHWTGLLNRFSNSLQGSLWNLTQTTPGFSRKWGAELKAMSIFSRVLAVEFLKRHGFKDKTEYDYTHLLLGAVFKSYAKSEKLMKIGKMPGATKTDTWSDFQTKAETESAKLSEQQKLTLVLFMCLSSTSVKNIKCNPSYDRCIDRSIDVVERAYYQIKAGRHLRVQQTLSSWQRDEQGVNLAQVSYKYALEVAPLCYSVVTCRLTKDMKIQMKEPGEITFCPVRHCRWCGQVETEQKELFVCQFCKDIPEYPDVNLFCSLDCEEKTLDQKHRQEHAEVVEMQLGLRDVEHFMENLSESPDCLDQLEPDLVGTDEDVKELEEPEPNKVADSTDEKVKDLPELETDVIMEGEVDARSFCGKCHNKEPKMEVYLVCKGGCERKFHLECINGALDNEGIVRDDFLATSWSAWSCERCPILPVADINKRVFALNETCKEVIRKMKLLSAQGIYIQPHDCHLEQLEPDLS